MDIPSLFPTLGPPSRENTNRGAKQTKQRSAGTLGLLLTHCVTLGSHLTLLSRRSWSLCRKQDCPLWAGREGTNRDNRQFLNSFYIKDCFEIQTKTIDYLAEKNGEVHTRAHLKCTCVPLSLVQCSCYSETAVDRMAYMEKGMAHSSVLAWAVSGTEGPMGSQRVSQE